MSKKVYLVLLGCFIQGAVCAQKEMAVLLSIQNTSGWACKNKLTAIPWQQIQAAWPQADTAHMMVTDNKGRQVAFQLEKGGSTTVQNLLVQVSVPAKSTLRLYVKRGTKKTFPPKVFGRLVPERYDDFAWENDRIAFRMYGKALEATTFNALGIDVWAKRTEKLVVDKWYKSEDYHTDHGEGLDFYGVGYTLGAGNNAPFVNDSLYHAKNFTKAEVLESGPLRFSFRLSYDAWLAGEKAVQKSMTITLDAGEQLNKIETEYSFEDSSLSIAAGINLKGSGGVQWLHEKENSIGYWLPKDSVNGTIGVGLVFPEPVVLKKAKGHLLAIKTLPRYQPFVYYAGAAWNKAGAITTAKDWFSYLQKFKQQAKHSLRITIKAVGK